MGSVDIPKKYKAAVYDKPGSISTKIEELDMPEPGAGEVLINLYVMFVTSQATHFHLYKSYISTNLYKSHVTNFLPIELTPASATPIWE
jgi:hypothetical protein